MPPITLNVRHLEKKNVSLKGEVDPADLQLTEVDELIHPSGPLKYDLEAQRMENGILVQGHLSLPIQCECARCLKPFGVELEIPDWATLLTLEGEDSVPISNDIVDLTPQVREDILLRLPQHPLCEPGCVGLKSMFDATHPKPDREEPSTWSELNKLKFNE